MDNYLTQVLMNGKPFSTSMFYRDQLRFYRGSNWQDAVAKRYRRFAIATVLPHNHPVRMLQSNA